MRWLLCNSRSKDRDVLISGFQTVGVILKSVSLQFQDIKELVRQSKEAISKGKGKISMCLNFPARYEIRTTEFDMKSLEDAVARRQKFTWNWQQSCTQNCFHMQVNVCSRTRPATYLVLTWQGFSSQVQPRTYPEPAISSMQRSLVPVDCTLPSSLEKVKQRI
ncbi:hypothetical protein AALP_AA1G117800 [Arabis alpina]|uniref:Uncharacterized protein n=1 Tax=Arabis alpina TaxID=50452 RepID=A0A087HMM1_ARAAL|nr:hypothetical protein AALP_AA1G117800 [Arabis alpina]